MDQIIENATRLKELKEEKLHLKSQLSEVEAELKQHEGLLVKEMETVGLDSIKIKDVGNVIVVNKHVAKSIDKQVFFAYLIENNLDGIITKTVNHNTLNTLSKEFVKENGKDLPGCQSQMLQGVTIRKT